MDRPRLQKLLIDIRAGRIDVVVVYKIDRLTRALADFAPIVETFDAHEVSSTGERIREDYHLESQRNVDGWPRATGL